MIYDLWFQKFSSLNHNFSLFPSNKQAASTFWLPWGIGGPIVLCSAYFHRDFLECDNSVE